VFLGSDALEEIGPAGAIPPPGAAEANGARSLDRDGALAEIGHKQMLET